MASALDIPDGWLDVVTSAQEELKEQRLPPYDVVEVFGGSGHLSEAAVDCGLHTWKFEILDTPTENFLTDEAFKFPGLQFLLQKIGAMRRFGLLFLSPPCSSWVWIARSQSKRSRLNVTGDEAKLFVKQANRVAELLAILMRLCLRLGVYFLVEQPE
eukprot:4779700-Amphidinium_carterae.1